MKQSLKSVLKFLERYGVRLVFLILFLQSLVLTKGLLEDEQVIRADGKGYYAYLPALFIYHDPTFSFIDEYESKYYKPEHYADFTVNIDGKRIDKYFSGQALLWLPFFLLAHFLSYIFGFPTDGYSALYQISITLAALFYFYLGIHALYRLLNYKFSKPLISVVTVAIIALGTNLTMYATWECSFTHVYSFSLICIFCLAAYRIFHHYHAKSVLIAAVCLGFIIALRPVNILIILFLPFLAGSFPQFFKGIKEIFHHPKTLLIALLLALLPILWLMGVWYWETGKWIVFSYGDEHFNFLKPQPFEFLFGYSKGWFVYTPLALLGVFSYVLYLRKKQWFCFVVPIFSLSIIVYVLSSWWYVTYGASFGSRPMIEFLIIPAFGLSKLMEVLYKKRLRMLQILLAGVFVFLILLNNIQFYQYRNFILKWDGMSQSEYWRIFMRTDKVYSGSLYIAQDKDREVIGKNIRVRYDYNGQWDTLKENPSLPQPYAEIKLDKNNKFSPALILNASDIHQSDSLLQITALFSGKFPLHSEIIISVEDSDKIHAWIPQSLKFYHEPEKEFSRLVYKKPIPKDVKQGEIIKIFIWNSDSEEELKISEFRVDIIEGK